MKHSIKVLLAALMIISFSCGKGANAQTEIGAKQEVSFNLGADPSTLDSRRARMLSDLNLIRTFNEGLYRHDKKGVPQEAVAKSIKLLDDKKTYIIELKETLWSNGDPVTAGDFIYAWKSALDKDFPCAYASMLFPLKNAKSIKNGLMPTSMLGAHKKGDYTLIVELEEPLPYFTELLTLPVYFPINQSIELSNADWHHSAETYVCNGPFKLETWKHKNEIVAVRNKRYWDKSSVKLQKLSMIMVDHTTGFRLYEDGKLSVVGSPHTNIPTDALKHLQDSNLLKQGDFLGTFWIRINTEAYPLQEENLRKALAMAINRKDIVEHVLSNTAEVATGLVPVSMGLADKPYFNDGDCEKAQRFLDTVLSGLGITKDELPALKYTYSASEKNHIIAGAVQDQIKKALGIEIQLEPLEPKVYIDKVKRGDYQLAWGSWIADYSDPTTFLEVFKTKSVGTNNTNWESLNYISAINESYQAETKEERMASLQKAEYLIMDEMPAIPVFHTKMVYLQDEKLKDLILSPTGSMDFKWAYVSN